MTWKEIAIVFVVALVAVAIYNYAKVKGVGLP
jgi:hypothetical protein